MKKTLPVILTTAMLLSLATAAFAANGDVSGHIYSTDIRAYINGVEVPSYNIGGKTAVVIEDILSADSHQCVYDDNSRTLKFFSLNPNCLVGGAAQYAAVTGKVVGNTYETDIKTSIYDVTVPSCNIGGKTAVAIEDLGYDGAFSPIGGKFDWDGEKRTISLEFSYENVGAIDSDKKITIIANESMTEAEATFDGVLHCGGGAEHFSFPEYAYSADADIETLMPIKADGETIGYYFRRPSKENEFTAFTYYYPDKLKKAEDELTVYPKASREDIISHFVGAHSVGEPVERFDTDRYSFVYISVAGTSWTAYDLLQVYDDGTYVDYKDKIAERNRSPINLKVDKENEKVTFRFMDRYNSDWFTDYEIDLKAGEIKAVESEEN